jgi:DUF1680 family protein
LQPGRWAELNREWHDGDRIEAHFDMPLRLVPVDSRNPDTVALLRGPVALFAIEPGSIRMTRQQLLAAQPIGNSGDWVVTAGQHKITMRPFPQIAAERYRLYQQVT